jgi:hypothetical protein
LGSGSTAAYAIKAIGERIKREGLHVSGVPTSYQAFTLAVKHGIPITTLEEHPILNLTIDGADQIDKELNLIKGMGGALAREKIVASASKMLVIVADESKKVEGWSFEQLLTSKQSIIEKWWNQTKDECPEGKIPLLVFTKNRSPTYIMYPVYWPNLPITPQRAMLVSELNTKICLLDDLFKSDPEEWTNVTV